MDSNKSFDEKEIEIRRWEQYLQDILISVMFLSCGIIAIVLGNITLYRFSVNILSLFFVFIGGGLIAKGIMELKRVIVKKRAGEYNIQKIDP